MPLPEEALRVEGGCNCGALRYCVEIPALKERPLHPLGAPDAPVTLPFPVLDHCNDCRRATASILPAWLCAPIDMCSVSLVLLSSATLSPDADARKGRPEEQRGPWKPALEIFDRGSPDTDHFVRSYESSSERWRWFCARCGTNIAYTAIMPDGFPNMLDITLGSVERRHLEKDELVPERHLWWDYGIDWIHHLATKGYGDLPIHANYHVGEAVIGSREEEEEEEEGEGEGEGEEEVSVVRSDRN